MVDEFWKEYDFGQREMFKFLVIKANEEVFERGCGTRSKRKHEKEFGLAIRSKSTREFR